MKRFRTMRRVVPWLVGLFLLAQFAGVVPRVVYAHTDTKPVAAHQHHQYVHNQSNHNKAQHQDPDQQHGNIADQCCALHLINGVLSLVIASSPIELASQPLLAVPARDAAGINLSPLDRPPRFLLSL